MIDSCGETHTACNDRLANEGGKAQCCYCVPHKGCKIAEPTPDRDTELREQIEAITEETRQGNLWGELYYDAWVALIESRSRQDQRALLKEIMEAVDAGYGYCGCASIVEGFMARLEGEGKQ